MGSGTTTTTGCDYCCTAAWTGRLIPRHGSAGAVHAWWRRALFSWLLPFCPEPGGSCNYRFTRARRASTARARRPRTRRRRKISKAGRPYYVETTPASIEAVALFFYANQGSTFHITVHDFRVG